MTRLLEQIKEHRNHIKHEALTFSLWELVNMYKTEPKEIYIRPNFQRLFRWTREQQSNFIESLILEMPIPPLIFFESETDGSWELLDGLQRISTIIKFMNSDTEIPLQYQGEEHNDDEWHYDHANNIDIPLQLLECQYLIDLKGFTFNKLPIQIQLNLKRSRIHVYVLKRETKKLYKYEIFKRLNKGGSFLEDQEIRNCSVRLLGDDFPQYIQDISKYENYITALGLDESYIKNAFVEELVLRFFAMKNKYKDFKHDVADFLTKYMEEVTSQKVDFNYDKEKTLFQETWDIIQNALTNGEAFRGKTNQKTSVGPFSPSLFEIISIGIASNIEKVKIIPPNSLKDKIIDVIMEAKLNGHTGSGSNSRTKTINRIKLGIESFSK